MFVDWGYRELLIRVDYVGKNILILGNEWVEVCLIDVDNEEDVVIINKNE